MTKPTTKAIDRKTKNRFHKEDSEYAIWAAQGKADAAQAAAGVYTDTAIAAIPHASDTVYGVVKVDGTTITATDGVITSVAGSVSGADPTAVAGDIAINGTSPNFIRADGAPAIQKADTTHFGLVKPDGTTVDATAGLLVAIPKASIVDDGTNINLAMSDGTGNLILDGSGAPVLVPEVFPPSAIPTPTPTTIGGVESIAAVAHNFLTSISTSGVPAQAQPATTDLSDITTGTWVPADASGAGITFSSVVSSYLSLGKLKVVSLAARASVNASGATFKITGLPFASAASWDGPAIVGVSGIAPTAFFDGTNVILFDNIAAGSGLTNSQMSGVSFSFTFVYTP